ncbi:hypothetical protein ABW42_01895 [Stenotrophomonas maltophilia]|nr:hypothetical protein ABW42_01895 [Stenotrophomonas maltophilia]
MSSTPSVCANGLRAVYWKRGVKKRRWRERLRVQRCTHGAGSRDDPYRGISPHPARPSATVTAVHLLPLRPHCLA